MVKAHGSFKFVSAESKRLVGSEVMRIKQAKAGTRHKTGYCFQSVSKNTTCMCWTKDGIHTFIKETRGASREDQKNVAYAHNAALLGYEDV